MRSKHLEPKRQMLVNITLIIDNHGAAACATLLGDEPVGPMVRGTGLAKKEPGDRNNPVIAENLAVGEALRDLGEQMLATGAQQVLEAMENAAVERVEAKMRKMQRHARGTAPRQLLPLATIQKQRGMKAAKVAAARRGVEWPPKKKRAKK